MKRQRIPFGFLTTVALLAVLFLAVFLVASYGLAPDDLPDVTPNKPESPREAPVEEPLPPMEFFRDVTASSGIHLTCRNGEEADHFSLLESLGTGVALLDYDGDGLLDVFIVVGGYFDGDDRKHIQGCPCKLYKNLGNWKFRDVTAEVGLDAVCFYAHGVAVADYDRDGKPDLLVTGYGRMVLLHNEDDGRGGRRFVERFCFDNPRWSTSAAWADLDGDGYPDLYVCHYVDWSWETHKTCRGDNDSVPRDVCPPGNFAGTAHAIYRNNRDGTFTDVSASAGIRQGPRSAGMGLGVVAVDVNGDRKPDIYAVNDTTMNFLYINESTPGAIRFRDVSLESGAAMGEHVKPDGSMGVDAADYDGSGRPSLFVTTFENERHALYQNDCSGERIFFQHVSRKTGIASLGSGFVGFGAAFIDIANSGWEDLVIANGHVRRQPTRSPVQQLAVILHNLGNGRFDNRTRQGGAYFQVPHRGRGLAVGDLDNDGRPDLVIAHLNEPVAVLRNDPRGESVPQHHWLGLELRGNDHRDIAGAKVVVDVGGRRVTRFVKGGGSYLSSGDRRILVGLGDALRIGRVTVIWPWGGEQHWDNLLFDRYTMLQEE